MDTDMDAIDRFYYDYVEQVRHPWHTDMSLTLLRDYENAVAEVREWLKGKMKEEVEVYGLKSTYVLLYLPKEYLEITVTSENGTREPDIVYTPIGVMTIYMFYRILADRNFVSSSKSYRGYSLVGHLYIALADFTDEFKFDLIHNKIEDVLELRRWVFYLNMVCTYVFRHWSYDNLQYFDGLLPLVKGDFNPYKTEFEYEFWPGDNFDDEEESVQGNYLPSDDLDSVGKDDDYGDTSGLSVWLKADVVLNGFKIDKDSKRLSELTRKKFISQKTSDWLTECISDHFRLSYVSINSFPKFKSIRAIKWYRKVGVITGEFADFLEHRFFENGKIRKSFDGNLVTDFKENNHIAEFKSDFLLNGFKIGDDAIGYDLSRLNKLIEEHFFTPQLGEWLRAEVGAAKDSTRATLLHFPKFESVKDIEWYCKAGVITREFADTLENTFFDS